jgi:CheY-like chemotaxis protein
MSMPQGPDRSSILIVDDMEENLVALEAVLGPLGQHLVTARSGEAALKAMLREHFAVVLLDVLMPGMDGFETAGNIKRLDQTKDVPIILLTGTDVDPDYAYRGYALGAADFLAKPVDPWVLRTKVNVFLELDRKNRQLQVQAEQMRRLLVAEQGHATQSGTLPGAAGPLQEPGSEREGTEGEGAEGAGAKAEGAEGESAEELEEVYDRLVQLEMLLRDRETSDSPELSTRIAELERIVQRLRPGGGTKGGSGGEEAAGPAAA